MLNNLRVAFMRQEDWPKAITVLQHLRIVQPELPAHLRDEGLIHYHTGDFFKSSKLLEEYLSQKPHAEDIKLIKSTVGAQFEQWAKLN